MNVVANSMEGSPPSEAKCFSVSQEIHRIEWSLKVPYRVRKSLPLVSVLSHTNPVHAFPPCFCKLYFNFTLPSHNFVRKIIFQLCFGKMQFLNMLYVNLKLNLRLSAERRILLKICMWCRVSGNLEFRPVSNTSNIFRNTRKAFSTLTHCDFLTFRFYLQSNRTN